MMKVLLLIICSIFLLKVVDGTVVERRVMHSLFQKNLWHPITKFVMGYGKGHYQLKIWNQGKSEQEDASLDLNLLVYTYDAWQEQRDKIGCAQREAPSVYKQAISVPKNGNVINTKEISLGQDTLVQVWYFALANCDDPEIQTKLKDFQIKYEFTIKNSDGSHISEEENGVMRVLSITVVFIFIFFAVHSFKLSEFYTQKAALDYPLVMLVFALILECLTLFTELMHLYFYASDGEGFFLMDWMNFIFANLSQLLISILFLLMAAGWTVKNLTKNEEEMFVIMGIVSALLIIFMALTSKISISKFDSFHDYGDWFGVITIVVKFLVFGGFVLLLRRSYNQCEEKLKDHYKKLAIFGSIYLLSFPIIVIIADIMLPPYFRHKAITYGLVISQSATLLIYASILSIKDGAYYPIVYKNRTLLPTGKMI